MNRILFQGIMPALVSPVNEDGSIREAVLRRLVLDLSATGITGFYLLGGTGEGVIMEPARRMELAEIAKDCAPQGMKLINHIAATDLSTVKKLARHARAIGLDAIASVPPFFYSYDEQGIIDYYRAMSDASDGLPLLIYASPLSGEPLPVSTVEKMLKIPGFIGMKYTNPNYFRMAQYKKLDNGNINILNGPDETCVLGLLMGADGAIGTTYNNMPRTFVQLYEAFKAGDIQRAAALQHRANELIELYLQYNVIAAAKAALELQGYDVGEPNAPLPRMSQAQKQAFWAALREKGFPEEY